MSVKISELPILDSLADNDILAGVDTSANVTSKIEMSTLKDYIDTNTQYTAGTNIDITNNVISAPNVPTKEEFDSLSMIYNAFPTESGEGESLTLDDTAEVKFKKFDLKGNTSQYSTTGANLYYMNYNDKTDTFHGTTIISTHTGYSITGTVDTSNTAYTIINRTITLPAGSYTLKLKKASSMKVGLSKTNYASVVRINIGSTSKTFTLSEETVVCFTLELISNTQYNETNEIMLYSGTTDKDFEPYTGGTASPNPSYPQDVHVVSGDNEINVCGKNLFKNLPYTTTYYGITMTNDGEKITFSGTNSSSTYYPSFIFYADGSVETTQWYASASNIKPNKGYFTKDSTEYIISLLKSGTLDNTYCEILIGRESNVNSEHFNNTSTTYTKSIGSSTAKVNFIAIGFQASQTVNLTFNIQLEKGSSATTYEPYIGNTYNIDLPVENLLQIKTDLNVTQNGLQFKYESDGAVSITGTANATSNYYIPLQTNIILDSSTHTFSCKCEGTIESNISSVRLVASGGISFGNNFATLVSNSQVYITSNDTNSSEYKFCLFSFTNGKSYNIKLYFQLEKGSKANLYTPYGTTPIEMCSNPDGTYRDSFIHDKTTDKWYLHKEIGKGVFDGVNKSLNYKHGSITSENRGFYQGQVTNRFAGNSGNTTYGLSNYLTFVSGSAQSAFDNNTTGIWWEGGTGGYIYFILEETSLTDANNWLKAHNTSIYYVLATPTNTEITYELLIEQLNAIEKATSKQGQTNINQVNNDKPFIIDAEAIIDLGSLVDRVTLLES